jgi:hypothetical protein
VVQIAYLASLNYQFALLRFLLQCPNFAVFQNTLIGGETITGLITVTALVYRIKVTGVKRLLSRIFDFCDLTESIVC